MKGKDLKELVNAIPEEFDDADVVIDTEARCFECHIVDVKNMTYQDLREHEMGKMITFYPDYSLTVYRRKE